MAPGNFCLLGNSIESECNRRDLLSPFCFWFSTKWDCSYTVAVEYWKSDRIIWRRSNMNWTHITHQSWRVASSCLPLTPSGMTVVAFEYPEESNHDRHKECGDKFLEITVRERVPGGRIWKSSLKALEMFHRGGQWPSGKGYEQRCQKVVCTHGWFLRFLHRCPRLEAPKMRQHRLGYSIEILA